MRGGDATPAPRTSGAPSVGAEGISDHRSGIGATDMNTVMTEERDGQIDYEACGTGATVVLVPGSCSTGAAWRAVIAAWDGRFRSITTSLLGYGGTAERRSADDPSIAHEVDMLESVLCRAGGRVHLVGHSFGGLVALAMALRNHPRVASLAVLEPPAIELLRSCGEPRHYDAFRRMTDAYFAAFAGGNAEAIAAMVDFYGGAGTFLSWPPRARAYAVATTQVNILDWASAYGLPLSPAALASIDIPVLVAWGGGSHPAMRRLNALLGEHIRGATVAEIEGAAHFMITTHGGQIAELLAQHIARAEAGSAIQKERSIPAAASVFLSSTKRRSETPP